jgi:hypothetical protein
MHVYISTYVISYTYTHIHVTLADSYTHTHTEREIYIYIYTHAYMNRKLICDELQVFKYQKQQIKYLIHAFS